MPESIENLTPMLRQYLEIKEQHRDAILFFRLGDFYEMFFEDAVQASSVLDITLTSRNKNAEESIPLCGVPYHSASAYIRKLIEGGYKVAICEQVEDPKLAKGIVKREVIRVISPGLWVDQDHLTIHEPNYLAAFLPEGAAIHLSFIDISTGEVLYGLYPDAEAVHQELLKHQVKELLIPPGKTTYSWLEKLKAQFPKILIGPSSAAGETPQFPAGTFALEFLESRKNLSSPLAQELLDRLLAHVLKTQRSVLNHLGPVQILRERQFLGMDERTFRHLELTQNAREGGRTGTLFWVLNQTQTSMGARRLKKWIHYPLLEKAAIERRQEALQELLDAPELLFEIQEGLKSIQDIERMLGKLALATVNARDLFSLAHSLKSAQALILKIRPKLSRAFFKDSLQNFPDLSKLFDSVLAQLLSELPLTVREGGMIAAGVHPELDELRAISCDGKSFIAAMEEGEKKRTGISSLKIRYNRVFGYYIEVTHTRRENVPADYIRKQTLANAERYITPELKEYESKVLSAEERIKTLEHDLFCKIRGACAAQVESIRKVAATLGELDVVASLARVARDYNYRRPMLCEEKVLVLRDSRHPVLERLQGEQRFIPNDLQMTEEGGHLFLITGPNMAGKSTVMRQVALIVVMAQMGGFVPASEARIGLVDQLFTRIGASDDLSQGQSTFMVEMLETSHILRLATAKSLIVLDEIGRGTSTYDGMSIAWAVAEYVAKKLQCRALFATHYHELIELSDCVPGIANYQVAVKEWNDQILFLRKLIPGGASRSYGIEVARLAGLPDAVLQRAREVLHQLESVEGQALERVGVEKAPLPQLSLFEERSISWLKELNGLQPENMTPMQALNFLVELKKKL